jgi:hypothetical protein
VTGLKCNYHDVFHQEYRSKADIFVQTAEILILGCSTVDGIVEQIKEYSNYFLVRFLFKRIKLEQIAILRK